MSGCINIWIKRNFYKNKLEYCQTFNIKLCMRTHYLMQIWATIIQFNKRYICINNKILHFLTSGFFYSRQHCANFMQDTARNITICKKCTAGKNILAFTLRDTISTHLSSIHTLFTFNSPAVMREECVCILYGLRIIKKFIYDTIRIIKGVWHLFKMFECGWTPFKSLCKSLCLGCGAKCVWNH